MVVAPLLSTRFFAPTTLLERIKDKKDSETNRSDVKDVSGQNREFLLKLKASGYSTLWHRFKNLEFEISESEDRIVDATRIKVSNRESG